MPIVINYSMEPISLILISIILLSKNLVGCEMLQNAIAFLILKKTRLFETNF